MSRHPRRKKRIDGVVLGPNVRAAPETQEDRRFSAVVRVEQVHLIIPAPPISSNFTETIADVSIKDIRETEKISASSASGKIILETAAQKPRPFGFKACELFLKTIIGKPC